MTGVAVTDQDSARRAGERLLQLGAGKVIITLGAQGALLVTAQGHQHYPAPRVQPLDTTAAGDTFIGGFAAALVRGLKEGEAIALVSVPRHCRLPVPVPSRRFPTWRS